MLQRIVTYVNDPSLHQKLTQSLSGFTDVLVESMRPSVRKWKKLTQESGDVFILEASAIPRPIEAHISSLLSMPDLPQIILFCRDTTSQEMAHLLAAGCEAILDADLSEQQLGEVFATIIEKRQETTAPTILTSKFSSTPRLSDFVTNSPSMSVFLDMVQRVVPNDVSLLILGETGVGKERLARAVHSEGPRMKGPFVAVNCGALPESLLESELFGHEKGAFTGAMRMRRGCFELAHGGTIFLDEIGELPYHLQVKLLRVLQEREIQRLGGERSITVDVRIMAATNRDLATEVESGTFRRDLYYRLGVMTLTIPPLRDRIEDIPDLVDGYLSYLRPSIGQEVYGVADDALAAMCRYSWPGNVRELINVIERGMLLCDGQTICITDLPQSIGRFAREGTEEAALLSALDDEAPLDEHWLRYTLPDLTRQLVAQVERAYLKRVLTTTGGRIGQAAQLAGIHERSLFNKMKQHGLRKEEFRSPIAKR